MRRLLPVAGLMALFAAGPALAAPIVLKFSADVPSVSETYTDIIKPWIDKVNAAAGDTMKIEYYGDGQLSKNGDAMDRVAAGVADIAWDLPSLYGARFPSLNLVQLPGIYSDPSLASVAMWRSFAKGTLGKELKDTKELHTVILMVTPPVSYFMKDPVKDLANFDGLKISMSSKQRAQIAQTMGATPSALRTFEYYNAIQKGVIDGVVSTVGAIDAFKLQELLHFYMFGPFGGGMVAITMNQAKYDSLPPQAKKAIDDNSGEVGSRIWSKALFDYENDTMKTYLKDPRNKQVFVDDATLAKWKKAFDPVTAEWVNGTPNGQAMLDAFKAELAAVK